MDKLIRYKIEEAASFFYKNERTENEVYLLNIILDLGKEYNKLVDEYNRLNRVNDELKKALRLGRHENNRHRPVMHG